MFEQLNPLARSTAWLEIFILMFVAFLIGYLFARWYYKKKLEETSQYSYNAAADRQINTANTASKVENYDTDIITPGNIKAIKTRERSGAAVVNRAAPLEKPELDFSVIGQADIADKDDLKKISGVGPYIEEKLNSIGIYTYEQISKFRKEDIENVTALIEFFPGRIERDNWKGQAEALHKNA